MLKKLKRIKFHSEEFKVPTLKGSLSVLKAMPGIYFSQTGNPLHQKQSKNRTYQIQKNLNFLLIYLFIFLGGRNFLGIESLKPFVKIA